VRIPPHQQADLVRLSRASSSLAQRLGREPTDREVAEFMGRPLHEIRELRVANTVEVSLDAPLDATDRDSASFGEHFADTTPDELRSEADTQAHRSFLQALFCHYLTQRERKILTLFYGLDGGEPATLEEIAGLLGVTRERVRQVRNRAVEKLRQALPSEVAARRLPWLLCSVPTWP
jgi:RNA polymerase primary sigma factor